MTAKVLHNQSILDIAIQHTGSVFNAFDIALVNKISVSEPITAGMYIVIPENIIKNDRVLSYYKSNKTKPATGLKDQELFNESRGIGWMKVGDQFKVD